jgi:hypothetical protein
MTTTGTVNVFARFETELAVRPEDIRSLSPRAQYALSRLRTLAVLHALANDGAGAIVGCLVAGAGALELHGVGLLRTGYAQGMNWLVRGQLLLLATMLLYAAAQLMNFDATGVARIPFATEQLNALKQMNIPTKRFVYFIHVIVYTTVGVVTLIYQGAMATYYHRRRKFVNLALEEEAADELDFRP